MNTTTSSATRTPQQAYDAARAQCASIQARLAQRMTERAAEFTRAQAQWALVAQEQRIVQHLAIVLALAGDRSAVDELKIPY